MGGRAFEMIGPVDQSQPKPEAAPVENGYINEVGARPYLAAEDTSGGFITDALGGIGGLLMLIGFGIWIVALIGAIAKIPGDQGIPILRGFGPGQQGSYIAWFLWGAGFAAAGYGVSLLGWATH